MKNSAKVIRLSEHINLDSKDSSWQDMPIVGELTDGQPMERFNRIFETTTQSPCEMRVGIWEATRYAEKLVDYPYNEIVFLLEGSISIISDEGQNELFTPGDCFFLQKGFNGQWKQHETIKIIHMTVAEQ